MGSGAAAVLPGTWEGASKTDGWTSRMRTEPSDRSAGHNSEPSGRKSGQDSERTPSSDAWVLTREHLWTAKPPGRRLTPCWTPEDWWMGDPAPLRHPSSPCSRLPRRLGNSGAWAGERASQPGLRPLRRLLHFVLLGVPEATTWLVLSPRSRPGDPHTGRRNEPAHVDVVNDKHGEPGPVCLPSGEVEAFCT